MAIIKRAKNLKQQFNNNHNIYARNLVITAEYVFVESTKENLILKSNKKVVVNRGDGVMFGKPIESPIANPIIQKGQWLNKKGEPITIAKLGENLKFRLYTKNIESCQKVKLSLFEKNIVETNTNLNITIECLIENNIGLVEINLNPSWNIYLDERFEGDELELFFKASFMNINKELTSSLLKVVDQTSIITVLIELPHTEALGKLNTKGMAGHTGIMVNEKFYDYGPEPGRGGDFYSDGQPWWNSTIKDEAEMRHVLADTAERDGMGITGRVILVDLYVTKAEADRVEEWWKKKYANLGNYSAFIVAGSQCTTTVRQSIEESTEVIPFLKQRGAQTPADLLGLLTKHGKHTSGKNKDVLLSITEQFDQINDEEE